LIISDCLSAPENGTHDTWGKVFCAEVFAIKKKVEKPSEKRYNILDMKISRNPMIDAPCKSRIIGVFVCIDTESFNLKGDKKNGALCSCYGSR
jgi:hypothetical protein